MIRKSPEKEVRKSRIDEQLEDCGWKVIGKNEKVPNKGFYATEEIETGSGPADYALIANGRIIGLVEAKKTNEPVYSVLTQAQRYAKDIRNTDFEFNRFRVPFIYSTNGNETYFQDLRTENSRSRKVLTFHTPNALIEFLNSDWTKPKLWFADNPLKNDYLRYYQKDAIQEIEKNVQKNKQKMLLAMATGTGKTWVNNHAHVLRPKDNILIKFLYYQLIFKDITSLISGTTRDKLNQQMAKKIPILLTQIKTQQKIVQKLDAFFESYNKLKQEKQKAKEKYEKILQSALVSLIESKKLSKGWEEKTVRSLVEENIILEIKSGFPCGKNNKNGEGTIHIRPMNVNEDGQIDLSNCKFVENKKEYEGYLLKEGDVIFNNTNSRELVGKTACFKNNKKCFYSNHMTRIRVDKNRMLPEFLAMYLHNLWKVGLFNQICHSHVSQASVNTNKLKEVKIVIPTMDDQKKIVGIIGTTVQKFKHLNEHQTSIHFQLSQLPKAVLSKAFKGEL